LSNIRISPGCIESIAAFADGPHTSDTKSTGRPRSWESLFACLWRFVKSNLPGLDWCASIVTDDDSNF